MDLQKEKLETYILPNVIKNYQPPSDEKKSGAALLNAYGLSTTKDMVALDSQVTDANKSLKLEQKPLSP